MLRLRRAWVSNSLSFLEHGELTAHAAIVVLNALLLSRGTASPADSPVIWPKIVPIRSLFHVRTVAKLVSHTSAYNSQRCFANNTQGHRKRDCEKPRKINRDLVADVSPGVAWAKLEQAARERDADDVKEAVQEYVKALNGEPTYRVLQEAFIDKKVNIWLIAVERSILPTFTNMDLQGNIEKKYTVSYRFSDKPERPREIEGWPQNPEEILSRLDDAGEVVNNGKSLCHNCKQVGHVAKHCPEEKVEPDGPRVTCSNCNEDGHRIRDCELPTESYRYWARVGAC